MSKYKCPHLPWLCNNTQASKSWTSVLSNTIAILQVCLQHNSAGNLKGYAAIVVQGTTKVCH